MNHLFALCLLLLGTATAPERSQMSDTANPSYQHPVISDYGRVVDPKGTAELPVRNSKVLFDVTAQKEAGKPAKGLDKAAVFMNLVGASGIQPDAVKVAVVLHGDATRAALTDEAYARHTKMKKNPNLELIQRLQEAGAEVYVCLQALAHQQYSTSDVAPDVTIAAAALTVNINKQMDGYAYLPFH